MTFLELRGVSKSYGEVTALSDVDLGFETGEFHCIVGPNGSGKTTLFRIVLGLTGPSAGTVAQSADAVIGCGFQRPNFYRGLTVAENLSVFGALVDADDDAWRRRVVETLRLDRVSHRLGSDLSGGYAKKLDLALALLDRPDALFLDEPLGDLDDVSKAQLLSFLDDYRDAGNAVVVSTHHLTDFEPYADRLTIVRDGEISLDERVSAIDRDGHETLQELYVDRVTRTD
jgi:ABC-2 type transport system ATP-binding protein